MARVNRFLVSPPLIRPDRFRIALRASGMTNKERVAVWPHHPFCWLFLGGRRSPCRLRRRIRLPSSFRAVGGRVVLCGDASTSPSSFRGCRGCIAAEPGIGHGRQNAQEARLLCTRPPAL